MLVYPVIWLDTLYGVFSYLGLGALRVSLLYRIALLGIGLYLIYTRPGPLNALMKVMIVSWAILAVISTYPVGNFNLVSEFTLFTRWLYPFTIFVVTVELLQRFGDQTNLLLKGIAYYGFIFGIFMLFSYATGLGIQSYGDYAFGIKSFYIGGNDIGLAALISLSFIFYFNYLYISPWGVLKIVLCLLGLLLLGTKAGWAGGIALSLLFVFLLMTFKKATRLSQKLTKYSLSIVVSIAFIGLVQFVNENIDDFEYQLAQVSEITKGSSPRERLMNAADRSMNRLDESVDLYGAGVYFYEQTGREYYLEQNNIDEFLTYKSIEQEWFDLYGGYGVFFAILVTTMHGFFLLSAFLLLIKSPTSLNLFISIAVFIFFAHGLFAGHAFVSGQPGGMAGVLYAIIAYRLYNIHRLREPSP